MEMTQDLFTSRVKSMYENGLFDPDVITYESSLREHICFQSTSLGPPTRAVFRSVVAPSMCNKLGNLHGGCAATIIDILTSVVLLAIGQPGMFSYGGVTRTLDVKYLRPVPEGMQIEIDCELLSMGKRLAMSRAVIRRVDNGDLCIIGMHDKVNTDPVLQKL
ncbi:hypothetical protein PRK78_005199 [Emydomyces testavorans]|uniref:Thioesterase domain-containing protein n=1 Tax=Emydomyces testavorans TaxID=2070801 RepID=A0AAF0DK17_9EURO|nr:hypothetical protein PRK78_005199 [Emydomyces testavorans]